MNPPIVAPRDDHHQKATVAALLIILGFIVAAVGGIWLLVVTFQESILWGIGALLVPLVSLIFVITHWEESKKPFLINVAGLILVILGAAIAPSSPHTIAR